MSRWILERSGGVAGLRKKYSLESEGLNDSDKKRFSDWVSTLKTVSQKREDGLVRDAFQYRLVVEDKDQNWLHQFSETSEHSIHHELVAWFEEKTKVVT